MACRIESLEAKQKVHLFDRLHTGYSLTPAGEMLLQLVARMEAEVNSIERGVLGRDGALKGEVRARHRPASLLYG